MTKEQIMFKLNKAFYFKTRNFSTIMIKPLN
jgi:hypothetical protein